MFKQDVHVHLHGCIRPELLWNIGKEHYKSCINKLEWYASEYEKAWGFKPDYLAYWEQDDGFERMVSDFIFSAPNPFDRFQANFNLIIALCEIRPDDLTVQEQIIRSVSAESSLEYFEARTLIPFSFSAGQTLEYLRHICLLVQHLNRELPMKTRLVFSLFRDNTLAQQHYSRIREFMTLYPDLSEEIAGIDFAYKEEGFPPGKKQQFFSRFHADNQKLKRLSLLYHVGESFQDKGLSTAIRWIYEVAEAGADRLGHATALGINPDLYRNRTITESSEERLRTLRWLLEQGGEFASVGFEIDRNRIQKEIDSLLRQNAGPVAILYDDDYLAECRGLQHAVSEIFFRDRVTIECCPTSNKLIGQISSDKDHPVVSFMQHHLNLVFGTDDPGLFGIDWKSESAYVERLTELSGI